MDDDLDLPPELEGSVSAGTGGSGEDGFFIPPPRGHPPTHGWTQRSQLAIDHVLAGAFESATRLLHDQVRNYCMGYITFKQKYFNWKSCLNTEWNICVKYL